MDGHVKHLLCRYRVHGDRDAAPQISSRLTRVLRGDLLSAYEDAMDKVFGDDPSVIVIRKLNSRLAISLNEFPGDRQLAQRWGGRLAGNAVRRIATASEGDEGLIRFDDQAEYVASYIADLISERAKHRWYYGAFDYLKGRPRAEIICQVLTDNRRHLAKTLSLLQVRGLLERMLKEMDAQMLRRLWKETVRQQFIDTADSDLQLSGLPPTFANFDEATTGIDGPDSRHSSAFPLADVKTDRQLFEQALNLLERLALLPDPAPDLSKLLSRFRPQVVVDWRDRNSLTHAFCETLDFLQSQGQVKVVGAQLSPGTMMQLDEVLRSYDWLDITRLRAHLLQFQNNTAPRVPRSLTPRQAELITALTSVLKQAPWSVSSAVQGEVLALQLYVQLIEFNPQWTDDELAKRLIEALAMTHAALSVHNDARQLRTRLRKADIRGVADQLTQTDKSTLDEGLSLIAALGEAAVDLLDAMVEDGSDIQGELQVTTQCAGVFLLLRAVADMRIPVLIKKLPGLSIEDLLISLLMRMAGEDAIKDGLIDAGLSLISNATPSAVIDALKEAWRAVDAKHHDTLQYATLNILAGQRLLRGETLNLYRLEQEDGSAWLIGGDAQAQIWPLGSVIKKTDAPEEILSHWLTEWSQATGRVPEHIVVDATLSTHCADALSVSPSRASLGEEASVNSSVDDLSRAHLRGRQDLLQALTALVSNQLGMARADLQCALLAIDIIRLWARWLNRFSDASTPYLLDNLLRRPGLLVVSKDIIEVHMDQAPLDVVIEMANYLNDLARLEWLGRRTIKFRIRR